MAQLNPQNYTHLAPVNLNPKHSKNSLFILSVTHICVYADGTAMVRQAGTAHFIFWYVTYRTSIAGTGSYSTTKIKCV